MNQATIFSFKTTETHTLAQKARQTERQHREDSSGRDRFAALYLVRDILIPGKDRFFG
jgi:hypothetical protein